MPTRSGPADRGLAWRLAVGAVAALCCGGGAAGSAVAPLPALQRAQLLSLGPWPPLRPADAAEPARRAAVTLGEQLFHSVRLAQVPGVRCASCHEPWRGFTDGRRVALGLAAGTRNTPTLVDVAQHRRFGWDGGQDELWRQSLRPLADPHEMPADAAHVATLLRDDPQLAGLRAAAFGAEPAADDPRLLADAGRALAAYVRTLTSARTPFDDWRDALAGAATAPPATPAFPAAAVRGARLFVGRGGCVACHAGPTLGGDGFAVSMIHSTGPDGQPDPGRAGAPRNLFRVPALRGVATTAPYMHDGSVATLCDALWPHALRPGHPAPAMNGVQRHDLLAFLEALSPVDTKDLEEPGPATPACGEH